MNRQRPRFSLVFAMVPRWGLWSLSLALAGCSDGPHLRHSPETLAGLELHHEISDEMALAAIGQLHGGAEIGVADAWIAQYGEEPSVMLYVAIAANLGEADSLLSAMRRRIAGGATPFRGVHDIRLSATDIYLVSGQGQLHFLFRDGSQVVWLSANPPAACLALAEALGASVEEVGCDADGTMAAPRR